MPDSVDPAASSGAAPFDPASLLAGLPDAPGVYRMLGVQDEVLYVGKAKNLKKRVSSYFQRSNKSPRIELMLTQVQRVEITVTRSEAEALILENTLIKRLAPKYNILFRDDKSYPYIVLTGDEYPRLAFHRGSFSRQARYFGPYPNSLAVRESIQLLQKIFRLRTCENSVFAHRLRPCLLYQIKRCTAPCVGLITHEDYATDVRNAEMFLQGQHNQVIDQLTQAMQQAADQLNFEEAAQLRDQVRALQAVLHRQYVSSTGEENVDILAAVSAGGMFCVNLAMVRGGQHLGDCAHFPRGAAYSVAGEEAAGLQAFIEQHYLKHPAPARLILQHDLQSACAAVFEAAGVNVKLGLPRNEQERVWLAMAEQNARLALAARQRAADSAQARLEALAEVLDCAELPARIECFDISHTQGEGTVASCVVCVDGSMKKSEYRRFNISGIQPGDDYAAMRQALTRRYEKVATGQAVAPDLIIIDGGKGQLGVAHEVLAELGLQHLASLGMAKGEARKPGEETLLIGDRHKEKDGLESVHLAAHHPALHLIQEIRDEAHRFAIFGHRARRDKARRRSKLEDVSGIGGERRRRLLAYFGGLQGVMAATVEDLCRVEGIGRTLAQQIYDALH
ncbi:MAG: excinuclease ABC subunit UvrC [Sterolibacterium sp.]|nr:excinuclease ABC subunit UvrC [Sterolibacterium sp.]